MTDTQLILVLGDQLSSCNPALNTASPGRDVIVFAEVTEEANYVRHNRHKIVLFFSAMRHYATRLRDRGFDVIYYHYGDGVVSADR